MPNVDDESAQHPTLAGLEQLADAAFEAILAVDEAWKCVYANAVADRLFERPRSQLPGSCLLEAEKAGERLAGAARVLRELPVDYEGDAVIVRDGDLEGKRQRIKGGWLLLFRDLSGLRAAERRSQVSAEILERALATIPHALVVWDEHHRVVASNPAYDRLLADVRPESAQNWPPRPQDPPSLLKLDFEEAGEHTRFVAERAARRMGGDDDYDLPLDKGRTLRVTSRRTSDGATISIGVDSEVTAATTPSGAPLRISALLAHDLRTPLNAILGFAQLLMRGDAGAVPEAQALLVKRIVQAGYRLADLLDASDPPSSRSPGLASTAAGGETTLPGATKNILYIEHDAANVAALQSLFADEPKVALVAVDTGDAAVAATRALRPSVVLVNFDSIDQEGLAQLARLRASPRLRHVPIIALLGSEPTGVTPGSIFDYHVRKPVVLRDLDAALRAVLLLT